MRIETDIKLDYKVIESEERERRRILISLFYDLSPF